MATKTEQPQPTTTPAKANKDELENLEEDDEFEEFEAVGGDADAEDAEDQQQWEDDWDTETVDDEFSKQLRLELAKPQPMATS